MTATELLLILGMVAVTFGVRYPVLALVTKLTLPHWFANPLKYVPVAVLTAITVPALLAPNGGSLYLSLRNEYLVAGLVAILVSWYSKNLLLTIAVGMATLWLWRYLLALL